MHIIVQLIGLVAALLGLAVLQSRRRIVLMTLSLAAGVCWTVHFGLLGAWTGSALNAVGVVRDLTCRTGTRPPVVLGLLVCCQVGVALAAGAWTGDSWLAALPATGMVISSLAIWRREPSTVRFATLASAPLWLAYNGIHGSLPGIAVEVGLLCSAAIGRWRLDSRPAARVASNSVSAAAVAAAVRTDNPAI